MSIAYKKHDLFPDSILIRDFSGRVSVNEIINSWQYIIENKLINNTIKGVINNLSNCDLDMDMRSFETLIAFLKKQKYLKKIKLAVICNNPKIIVFPILGENEEHDLKIKAFATMNAAVSWVLIEGNVDEK